MWTGLPTHDRVCEHDAGKWARLITMIGHYSASSSPAPFPPKAEKKKKKDASGVVGAAVGIAANAGSTEVPKSRCGGSSPTTSGAGGACNEDTAPSGGLVIRPLNFEPDQHLTDVHTVILEFCCDKDSVIGDTANAGELVVSLRRRT